MYKTAMQAVFGEGPKRARVMFVGEQPGDQEDRQGAPFVGPAGALLDKALACRPWLQAELRTIRPDVVVCLGATAAQSVIGSPFKLMQPRGEIVSSPLAARIVATIHPSAVLRASDTEGRREAYEMLVGDLKVVARALRV